MNLTLLLRVRRFQDIFSERYPALRQFYGTASDFNDLFEFTLHSWVEIAKKMSKVRPATNKNKKSRQCNRVCESIIQDIIRWYGDILNRHPSMRFEHMLQRLYVFDQQMAFLLIQIVFDVLQDQRFKDIQSRLSLCKRSWILNPKKATFKWFFGWDLILLLGIPRKNISFYWKQHMLRFNSRKAFLTTSGWIKLLLRKFQLAKLKLFNKSENKLRMELFNIRRFFE